MRSKTLKAVFMWAKDAALLRISVRIGYFLRSTRKRTSPTLLCLQYQRISVDTEAVKVIFLIEVYLLLLPSGRPRNILIDTVSTELPKLTGMVKIKIDYQEDVYQIMVPNSITFTALMEKVEKKIRMCLGKPKDEEIHLKVRYIDEDGDYVTIKTNEDIQTSFKGRDSSLPYTVLNLYVNEV